MVSDPLPSASDTPPATPRRRGRYRVVLWVAIGIVLGFLPFVVFPTVEEADGHVEISIRSKSGAPIKKLSWMTFSDRESAKQAVTQTGEMPRVTFYPVDREDDKFVVHVRWSRRTETWLFNIKKTRYVGPRYIVLRAVYEDGKDHRCLAELTEECRSMTVEVP
jgi:hypothetical protein